MFLKPSPPAVDAPRARPRTPFAQTQFLHDEADDDYSGFAPTELVDDDPFATRGNAPGDEAWLPPSWGTSHWAALDDDEPVAPVTRAAGFTPDLETRIHAAARQAREVISAQRRGDAPRTSVFPATEPPAVPAPSAPRQPGLRGRVARLLQRLLPGELASLLPLFLCVSAALALIAAVLPLLDTPGHL